MRWVKAALRRPAKVYLRAYQAARGPHEAILVLGHMRSGSTLLLHLLMGHPEIIAAGERNTVYTSHRDLDRLAQDCFLVNRRLAGRFRYAADQLNHDHLLPRPQLILHPRVRPVILVRRPEPTIGSIVRTFAELYEGWTPARAAAYYAARIDTLAAYARRLVEAGRAPTLVSYEALTGDTEATLARLRTDLALASPLRADYSAARFTGRRGDPSGRIHAGRVRADAGAPVTMAPEDAACAEAAYRQLCAVVEEG